MEIAKRNKGKIPPAINGYFWKTAAILLGSITLAVTLTTVALATNDPHEGTFTSTTASCASCHRAHTATSQKILISSSQYNLCVSCHDGTGADTKVTTGVYLGTTAGTQNAGLRGGGFDSALMNTALSASFNTTGTPVAVTSKHAAGSSGTVWGSGNSSSGSGETADLECNNCHNPHGNDNYRILRPSPTSLTGWDSLTPEVVPDETTKKYTITYDADEYRDITAYDSGVRTAIANWCSQCHTRYLADIGSGSTGSGDAIFKYRHPTSGISGGCVKCHAAHGTTSTAGAYSGAVTWPDDSPGGGVGDSRLLHVDNRGTCTQCHLDSSGDVVVE